MQSYVTSSSRSIARHARPRTQRWETERWVTTGGTHRPRALRHRPFQRTWCRDGVEALVAAASKRFTAATGIAMPWNLATHGPWVGFSRADQAGDAAEMVSIAARLAGFLDAVAEGVEKPVYHYVAHCDGYRTFRRGGRYPLLLRLISRMTNSRGCNSPATTLDLYRLVGRSPGHWEQWLGKVIRRADAILRPYRLRVSWQALALAASSGDRRPARAARRAAAIAAAGAARRLGINVELQPDRLPVAVLAALRGLGVVLASCAWRLRGRRVARGSELSDAVGDAMRSGEAASIPEAVALVRHRERVLAAVHVLSQGETWERATRLGRAVLAADGHALVLAAALPPPAENDGGDWLCCQAALDDYLEEMA